MGHGEARLTCNLGKVVNSSLQICLLTLMLLELGGFETGFCRNVSMYLPLTWRFLQ